MKSTLIALLSGLLLNAVPLWCADINISAAASLAAPLKDIVAHREKSGLLPKINLNLTSSGALARQIASGAPVDIFISADRQWIDYLLDNNHLDHDSVHIIASNRLVVAGVTGISGTSLADLSELNRIAVCTPEASPAGKFARLALENAGMYDALLTANQLIQVKDVLQAMMYLERGEVDAAFVYRTDALSSQRATILFDVPTHLYPAVVYPAALTLRGAENPEVRRLFDKLLSEPALQVFTDHGFTAP